MSTNLFCLNNTYYYSKAKRIIQRQQKRVILDNLPVNRAEFRNIDSYIEQPEVLFDSTEYSVAYLPKRPSEMREAERG